jgi:hypothetical protein
VIHKVVLFIQRSPVNDGWASELRRIDLAAFVTRHGKRSALQNIAQRCMATRTHIAKLYQSIGGHFRGMSHGIVYVPPVIGCLIETIERAVPKILRGCWGCV